MSDFRETHAKAHPNKTNTIMTGIIFMLIFLISIQVWFLFGALNNALQDNIYFAITTFVGSALMALAAFWLLRYLPDPIKDTKKKKY